MFAWVIISLIVWAIAGSDSAWTVLHPAIYFLLAVECWPSLKRAFFPNKTEGQPNGSKRD